MRIDKSTLDFLSLLKRNNSREWFQKNKTRYTSSRENVTHWVDDLIAEMSKHDHLQTNTGKESLYRIYNDVRFSADKTPYNPRFAGHLKRMKPELRGGYYFWIKPGATRVGCGFTYPDPQDLLRIRQDIDLNHKDWQKLLRSKGIQGYFGSMRGDHLKTAPKGFAKDHAAIDLLRHKQFWFERPFTDTDVLAPDFLKKVNQTYKAIRPFFNYMTDVLTTNANGESLLC